MQNMAPDFCFPPSAMDRGDLCTVLYLRKHGVVFVCKSALGMGYAVLLNQEGRRTRMCVCVCVF